MTGVSPWANDALTVLSGAVWNWISDSLMLRRLSRPCGTTGELRGKLVNRAPNFPCSGEEGYMKCWNLAMQSRMGHLTTGFLRSGDTGFAERGEVFGTISSASSAV